MLLLTYNVQNLQSKYVTYSINTFLALRLSLRCAKIAKTTSPLPQKYITLR